MSTVAMRSIGTKCSGLGHGVQEILRRAFEIRFWSGLPVVLAAIPSHGAHKRISSVVERSLVNHQNSFCGAVRYEL